MSWNTHAYQYNKQYEADTEEQRLTEPLKDDMQPQYRFEFEEFESRKGFLLLDRILDTIIPQAAYKVWRKIYDLVPNDPMPYIGSEAIAAQADVTYRQINRALQALKEMGLMEEEPSLAHTEDGKGFAVIRKDFTNLYKFAHEYYLWMTSQGFSMYPPDRRFADMIKENRHLYAKLVRFENYRIILKTERRGPKQVMTELVRWNKKETIKLDDVQLGEIKINDLEICLGTSKYQSTSQYYESNSNYSDSIRFESDTRTKFVEQDSPLARNEGECRYSHDERGTHEEVFTMGSGKGSEEYSFSIPNKPQQGNISQRKAEPSRQRNVLRTVISAEAQQFGDHIVEHASKEKKRVHDSGKEKCCEEAEKSKAIRERNKAVINLYSHIAHELNDEYEKSTGTSLVKMYEAWEPTDCAKSLETFTERFDYARQKVLAKPNKDIIKRTKSGASNRTPLFKIVIQGALTKGMEACIADDEQAQKVRDMWKVLGHKPTEEELAAGLQIGQELDARAEALVQAENNSQSWLGPLAQHILESYQARQEIMADVEVVEPEQVTVAQECNVFSRDRVKWEACQLQNDYLEMARQQIHKITGAMTKFGSVCSCGCTIKSMVNFNPYCVQCSKPKWSEKICTQVNEILANVPTLEYCENEAIMQIEAMGYEIA
jgi:hypothetical protein